MLSILFMLMSIAGFFLAFTRMPVHSKPDVLSETITLQAEKKPDYPENARRKPVVLFSWPYENKNARLIQYRPYPDRIDINHAPVDLLSAFPEITPSMAEAIVDYRQRKGRLESLDELLQIPGFTQQTIENIRYFCTLGEDVR